MLRDDLVGEELLVRRERRVELGEAYALRLIADYDAHLSGRVAVYLVVFGRAHDALLIELVQAVGDELHVERRESGYAVAIVGEESAHHLRLHLLVVVVVGLVGLEQRVFLRLYGGIGLVYGEVELGYERAVHPRFAHVVLVALAFVVRQSPHDERHGDQYKERSREHVAPENSLWLVQSVHINQFV